MAASNIGTGLGIALGGRAKDFTQIELAQRRQAAMEEKAKAAAKDKKLEDITKDISIKPGEYFQFREKEVERMLGEYIEGQMSGSMDYGEAQKARWNLLTNLEKYKQEKKRADEFRKQALEGKAATDDDINILYTASTPEEVASSIKRGGIITAPDGAYTINGYKVVDIPKRQMEIARNVKTEYDIANSQTTPDGKRVYIGEPKLEDYKAMLGADFDQNPEVVRNVISRHRDEFEQRGLEGDALIAAAREKYTNIGSNFLSGRAFKSIGGDTNLNLKIGLGGEQTPATTPVSDNKIMIMGTNPATGNKFLGTYTRAKTWTLGDAFATIPPGVEAYYGDTGEPVSSADIEKATFNDLSVGYVLNRDVTLSGPFGKVKFKKGQPILDEYFDIASQNNLIKPGIIAASKVGDRTIYSDGERFLQTKAITASKEDTPMINENIKEIRSFFDSFNREFESSKKRKAATPSATPKKEWGGMPSSTQKPVSSQGGGKAPSTKFKGVPSGGFN